MTVLDFYGSLFHLGKEYIGKKKKIFKRALKGTFKKFCFPHFQTLDFSNSHNKF